jgi:hypothetical protein
MEATGQQIEVEARKLDPSRRGFLVAGAAAATAMTFTGAALAQPGGNAETTFRRVSTQYIAALGAPDSSTGNNAHLWGLWRRDPGPRGVTLDRYERLQAAGGVAPAGWTFDNRDWWLEELGLIMEQPEFPLPPGRYLATGFREVRAVLTVLPVAADGGQAWALADGASLHDVTHLACRAARYRPAAGVNSCTPAAVPGAAFPVAPGGRMPPVSDCDKLDYAVLAVIGIALSA